MAATATLNGGKQQVIPSTESEEEKPKRGNPLLKKLEPEMLKNPYPMELLGGRMIDSDQLCYQRAASFVFEPLEFKSEKECVEFAKGVWAWINSAEERRQDQAAENLLAQAQEDPRILAKLKAKIAAM